MATALKIIDISRSYIPIDPRSFPESMHSTSAEDAPEGRIPVVPYDGYNFMPTAYGYMSYFGIGSLLGVNALTKLTSPFALLNVDDLFIIQTTNLHNIMVALCEDGIYTKYAASTGAWTHDITLTEPDSGEHKNYTKCVIGNEVYIYRAGENNIWVCRVAEEFVPTALNPSSNMNMSAQQGIFKAGGRLALWDSANSIAWSDIDDKMDLVPSLETGAGATIFQQIVGKIVNCLQHGNGFVIYCTRAIVHVRRTADANFFWASETIFNDNGISYLNEVTQGQPDTTHFAYTTFGIVIIKNGASEYIIPEVFTYLKEKRDPVYVQLLEGRYLFFQFLNVDYILGIPNFSQEGIPGSSYTFKGASYNITHVADNACRAIRSIDSSLEGAYLFDTYGYVNKSEAIIIGQVPIWQDNLSLNFPIADMKVFKATGAGGVGSPDYFDDTGFTKGGITKVSGGTEFFIPTKGPALVSTYPTPGDTILQEANTQDFYAKQDLLWFYESWMFEYWKEAISRKEHKTIVSNDGYKYDDSIAFPASDLTGTDYETGPFIDLSFFSEANKYYGLSANRKSAWLQRSLTKGITIRIEEQILTAYDAITLMRWGTAYGTGGPSLSGTAPNFTTVAALLAGSAAIGTWLGTLGFTAVVFTRFENQGEFGFAGDTRAIRAIFTSGEGGLAPVFYPYVTGSTVLLELTVTDFIDGVLTVNTDVYRASRTRTQTFSRPIFKSIDYPTCTYKNLGFTKISGHGHYNSSGVFVVDDATPEASAYTDQCDAGPKKLYQASLLGNSVANGIGQGCLSQDVTVDGEEFVYPDQVITLPAASFLMQDGSIEPIYPTFQGAFVYDLQYKKWGKVRQAHKLLLNYSPINSQAGDRPIPADIFNVNAGCLLEDGTIAIFDKYPENSMLVIGKVGYFRKGFTDCEEVRLQFRNPATGNITVEGSFDGKNIEPSISQTKAYENVNEFVGFFSNSARWFNIIINGIYDIKNIDFSGRKKGKR